MEREPGRLGAPVGPRTVRIRPRSALGGQELDQVTGKLCETFVAGELLRHASWSQEQPRLFHYQRDREDVDLVLENNRGQVVGVEVKAAATLRRSDWKWLAKLADARGDSFSAGMVVYAGEQTIPLGNRLWAVPYSGLWA